MYLDVVFLNRKRPNCGRASTKYGLGISESQQQHCNVLLHGSIEEWCLRGVSLNRETSPVMSSLFLPPLSCLCTRSVHQILFYSIYQQQVLQGCNLELLICWSVVEGLKPKCKMKISVQKLADWLMNFELNINQNLTFSQSSFFQPNPKTRVGVCVKEEDRGYKAADCE